MDIRTGRRMLMLAISLAATGADDRPALPPGITAVAAGLPAGRPLSLRVGGRVVAEGAGFRRQWPGSYAEARFHGPAVSLAVGPGDVSLRITVDGNPPLALVRPAPGLYRIATPGERDHDIRIQVVSESQAGATSIAGLYAPVGTTPLAPPPPRTRQIEFIGDSHTVGYGNTSARNDCTQDQVWATTDTAQGPAGTLAAHYGADYQVDAISGRGVVRNYDGFASPTVPQAYPFALLDGKTPDRTAGWRPQLVVIGLGTNDFSTKLKPGERWTTREALHADYERSYVAFVRQLRRRYPGAFVLLWATDLADGEIAREAERVAAALRRDGDRRVAFVPVAGLRFAGCHSHPDVADDRAIAAALGKAVDAQPDVWLTRR